MPYYNKPLYYGYTKDQRHHLLSIQHIHCSNHEPRYNCQLGQLYHSWGSYTVGGYKVLCSVKCQLSDYIFLPRVMLYRNIA